MVTLAINFGNQVEHGPLLSGCNFVKHVPECIFQAYAGDALIQADITFEYQRFASLFSPASLLRLASGGHSCTLINDARIVSTTTAADFPV